MSHEEVANKGLTKDCMLESVWLRRSQDDLELFK